jgi:predicted nucleic acid-binding protein
VTVYVLDASVLLASEDSDDPNREDANRLLEGSDPLVTLDLAYYETANVAVRSWRDSRAASVVRDRVSALAAAGDLVRADAALLTLAAVIAEEHHISVYDAAYVAAAQLVNAQLVSCDTRDLVSRGLACLPGDATYGRPTAINEPQ